jgi:hypothetical protein
LATRSKSVAESGGVERITATSRRLIEGWKGEYNEAVLRRALGNIPPSEYAIAVSRIDTMKGANAVGNQRWPWTTIAKRFKPYGDRHLGETWSRLAAKRPASRWRHRHRQI